LATKAFDSMEGDLKGKYYALNNLTEAERKIMLM